jgi:glycosyltransferase involved in cell wall biosynthesis
MERVLTEKVNYLSNISDFDITVVTTDQMARSLRFPLNENVQVIHLNIDFNGHYSAGIFKKIILHRKKIAIYKEKLKHIIIESNIDICISLCGKEIDFLYKLPVRCKKIAELHFAMNYRKQFLTSNHRGFLWSILGEIRTYQLKKAVKSLDKLVVLTKHDLEQWQLSHPNTIQIPNFNHLINPDKSKLKSKNVVSLGKLDAQKGYDMLIDAWRLIAAKHPDWTLEIYGHGEWYQLLQDKIIHYNLKEKVVLKGIVSNVEKVYYDSESLWRLVNAQIKRDNPPHAIQIWCADMWAVLWNLWFFNKEVKVDDKLGFSWATSPIEDFDKYPIYHNAGVVHNKQGLFFKADYMNNYPYDVTLELLNNTASFKYWEAICDAAKNTKLL